jgi:HPt (histidine-containing phosphotransfer) domain-containing protein
MIEKWLKESEEMHDTKIIQESLPKDEIFDKNSFLERLLDDEDLAREIIKEFLEDSLSQIDTIKKALSNNNPKLVHRQAHSLKGAAANVSATALKKLAYQIEIASKTGDMAKASSLISKLVEQFEALKKRLTQQILTID